MSVFLDSSARIVVQGMTGSEGRKHTRLMLGAGTNVVGGTNPKKAGQTVDFDIVPLGEAAEKKGVKAGTVSVPVCGTVKEAMEKEGANVSVVFVPPRFAKGAVLEAVEAGMPGIITPGQSNVGITPADITGSGPIGLVSKSGTLTYQMMFELRDIGFTTCMGIGGDPVVGTTHIDALEAFEKDPDTKVIVMIGEIGGDAEERAADYIAANVTKPVIAYVAGFTAPKGKTMGHAGAIVSGSAGTAQAKQEALEAHGVKVGKTPSQTAELAREAFKALS